MLGGRGVIRLVPDEDVHGGLGVAEGIEKALAVMQRTGWRPVWSAGCAAGIKELPVMPGIDTLTLFADQDLPGLEAARACCRRYPVRPLKASWQRRGGGSAARDDEPAGALLDQARRAVRALSPDDAGQRWLRDQALQAATSLLRQRRQMIEHAGPSVRPVVLAVVVCWIVAIFAGFGLNAPRNATVAGAFLVCSLAIGGAVFLILEMDSPFEGVLRISARPMLDALAHMGP